MPTLTEARAKTAPRTEVDGLSVLLPVYGRDDPEHLRRALDSVAGQTVPADEVVVVEDGPIGAGLEAVLRDAADRLPLRRVSLARNLGMGCAMQVGLEHCRYGWVARMDADDICRSDRFEIQRSYLEQHPEVDVVGSWIAEFEGDESAVYAQRQVPLDHGAIRRFAATRNPMNHMSVVFRRDAALGVGGYDLIIEDFYLWARMLHNGHVFANIPDCLVNVRAGRRLMGRRGGLRYALHLAVLYVEFHRIGFISRGRMLLNLATAVPVRLFPASVRRLVYRTVLRKRVR